MHKKRFPKPVRPKPSDSLLKVEKFGIDPDKHAEFKAALLGAARAAVAAFPVSLEAVKAELRQTFPEHVLTAFFSYGMRALMDKKGNQRKAAPDILQHHGELLHAVTLTLPVDEWGHDPLTPAVTERLFAAVPRLADTFVMQRMLEGEGIEHDKEAMVARSLQERIRLHTHGVRNWGYYDEVVKVSRDLYGALDDQLRAHHRFSATDMIDTLAAIVAEFEHRSVVHWQTLAKVVQARTPEKLIELYYRHVPDLKDNSAEMLATMPKGVTRDQMLGMLMAHFDLRLLSVATFTVAEVATLTGRSEAVTRAILRAVSLAPGALIDSKPEHLFLDNPVWDHPAILMGDRFVFPLPSMAFSHIHRLMDRLVAEAAAQQELTDRRATYLEQQLEAIFRQALPEAEIKPALKWKQGNQIFENDLVVVIDRVVIVAEAKSHRLTPAGLRGGAERVKRHIRDMVLDPSVQSARLEAVIAAARNGDKSAAAVLAEIGIDPQKADRVIRLSVTLDDLSVLTTAEDDFKMVGWVPDNHALAPSILIEDLRCIVDILDNPGLLLHYLNERYYLQKSLNLLGDELDFLGLYLVTGFNVAALYDKFTEFTPSGMSAPIDRYYEARQVGLNVPKPKMTLRPLFRDIIDRVTLVKPEAWTLISMHLLSCADPGEQKAIEQNLLKLRGYVRRNYRDPEHASVIIVQPPEKRKAPVMFYLFPEPLRAQYRVTMTQLASEAIANGGLDACVVFSRSTEHWGQAFESVMLLERGSAGQ